MNTDEWEMIGTVPGRLQAELLRGLLEAQGIDVILSQEGAGQAIGLTVGLLGEVDIYVPTKDAPFARQLLEDYLSGKTIDSPITDETMPDSDQG